MPAKSKTTKSPKSTRITDPNPRGSDKNRDDFRRWRRERALTSRSLVHPPCPCIDWILERPPIQGHPHHHPHHDKIPWLLPNNNRHRPRPLAFRAFGRPALLFTTIPRPSNPSKNTPDAPEVSQATNFNLTTTLIDSVQACLPKNPLVPSEQRLAMLLYIATTKSIAIELWNLNNLPFNRPDLNVYAQHIRRNAIIFTNFHEPPTAPLHPGVSS